MSTSLSIGKPENANFPIPYIPNMTIGWRTLTGDDGSVNTASVIAGSVSRFGAGNTAFIDVAAASAGVVVALYVKENGVYFFISSQTTTQANQRLVFQNLTGQDHYVKVTSVVNPTVLNAGITQ